MEGEKEGKEERAKDGERNRLKKNRMEEEGKAKGAVDNKVVDNRTQFTYLHFIKLQCCGIWKRKEQERMFV